MAYEDTFGIAPPVAPEIQQPWYQRLGSGLNTGMNGLLGGTQANYGGLLGEEQQKAAQKQAQLAFASQMLQAGGYSPQRVSFGQALGSGIQAGQQAQSQATQDAIRTAIIQKQLQPKPVTPPASVKEYEYAKANGYAGTYDDFRRTGSGQDPSAVREFEYAKKNGFGGTFEEFKRVGSAQHQDPSAVQEYNFYQKLTPAQQAAFIDLKRNSQPYQVVDVGGGKQKLNKSTGQLDAVTTAEQEASGAGQVAGATAGAKVAGEAKATAQVDLPRVQANADQALKTIDAFEKHPGFNRVFGWDGKIPAIPGTDQAGALGYYDQIKGKTFLEAFNSLKGAGQITEIEGAKATDAIARLSRSQSESDAKVALKDLKSVISSGLERAKTKAGETDIPKRVRVDAQGNVIGN